MHKIKRSNNIEEVGGAKWSSHESTDRIVNNSEIYSYHEGYQQSLAKQQASLKFYTDTTTTCCAYAHGVTNPLL